MCHICHAVGCSEYWEKELWFRVVDKFVRANIFKFFGVYVWHCNDGYCKILVALFLTGKLDHGCCFGCCFSCQTGISTQVVYCSVAFGMSRGEKHCSSVPSTKLFNTMCRDLQNYWPCSYFAYDGNYLRGLAPARIGTNGDCILCYLTPHVKNHLVLFTLVA